MEKSTTKLLNKLFNVCGLPEDPPEPIGASFFPIGLSDIPLVQRAKMEQNYTVKVKKDNIMENTETGYTCMSCGVTDLTKNDMAKDSSVATGIKRLCKKCVSLRDAELEKVRRNTRVILDFRKIKNGIEILEKIKKNAEDNCRTPEAEVIFMLKSAGFLCFGE